MSEKEENFQESKELNYKNNATKINPLIAQLYRCELEENGEEVKGTEDNNKEPKREKSPPQPIFRAAEHKKEVFFKLKYILFF